MSDDKNKILETNKEIIWAFFIFGSAFGVAALLELVSYIFPSLFPPLK